MNNQRREQWESPPRPFRKREEIVAPSVKRGFLHSSVGKASACKAGDLDSIPGLGRSRGEGKGYPLQYSSLENYTDCIFTGSQRVGHNRATFLLYLLNLHNSVR